MNTELLLEIEKLQLPHRYGDELEPGWIEELLADYEMPASDMALQLSDDVLKWSEGSEPSELIRHVISHYLAALKVDQYSLSGGQYLTLFQKIQKGDKKNWRGLDWFTAKLLLSKARVVGYLCREEHYSASQVVKVLSATESSLRVPFQTIGLICDRFDASVKPPSKEMIDATWVESENLGDKIFADASVRDSCGIASQISDGFAPNEFLERDLLALSGVDSGEEPSWNYLQMLYWQALLLETHDHPATWLYEFVPRGSSALHLFDKFELATNNPFLNNAKGTAVLGNQWALNRGGDDAHALVSILAQLENHPRSASLQTSRVLRAWITRTLAVEREKRSYIEILDSEKAYGRIIEAVKQVGTGTHGVIEQRVVDALSVLAFSGESWKPNGLGDHVNTTNTSRKKLGDVEFASAEALKAVAVEAHGGKLSRVYSDSHMLSLERSIRWRLESSWANLAEASDWTVDVIFVAHSYSNESFQSQSLLHDVQVNFEYIDYEELHRRAVEQSSKEELINQFDQWVTRILNSASVRQKVRAVAADLMGDAVRLVAPSSTL